MNAAQRHRIEEEIRAALRRETDRGRTQESIASEAGLHKTTLSKFMSGDRGISLELLERVAAAIGLTIVTKRKK